MSTHLSEDEQLENLKRWWNENGRSTVVGVVLAVVAYFGWQGWQSQQQQKSEAASVLYDELLEVVIVPQGQTITEEQIISAFSIADELKEKYSGGLYASNAALFAAKLAVEQDDLDRAESELQWVIDEQAGEPIELVARQRMAQVYYAKEQYDQALSVLDAVDPASFASGFAELRGDILVAKDQLTDARNAYELALNNLLAGQAEQRNIVQMKLNDLSSLAPMGDVPEGAASEMESDEADTAEADS